MRRAALAIVGTVAALVMLLSFKTHAAAPLTTPPAAVSSSGTSASGSSTSSSSPAPTATKTVTGDAVETRFGPVQVKITVTDGKLTSVTAIAYPQSDPRDQQINSYAIPQLDSEALQAGSANISMISGATFTSTGYVESLQSALDKANS